MLDAAADERGDNVQLFRGSGELLYFSVFRLRVNRFLLLISPMRTKSIIPVSLPSAYSSMRVASRVFVHSQCFFDR